MPTSEYQNDATRPYGHAFKAMEAYEKWFAGEGEKGQRQLAILRLLGLFDRPASKDCLDALRAEPRDRRPDRAAGRTAIPASGSWP